MLGKSAISNGLGDVCKGFRVSAITSTIPRATCYLFKEYSAIINGFYTPHNKLV